MQKKWLNEYGPVVGLMYGSHPTIAVVGAETVLEVLRREEFQGRPDAFNGNDRLFNKRLGKTEFISCTNINAFITNHLNLRFYILRDGSRKNPVGVVASLWVRRRRKGFSVSARRKKRVSPSEPPDRLWDISSPVFKAHGSVHGGQT
jgi:hypothetical protein